MTPVTDESVDSILAFWFGHGTTATEISGERQSVWWEKHETVDREITTRFESVTEAVAGGRLDHWRSTPKGGLASILCCDQFPRNMYRGKPESFAYDDLALAIAEQMVATGADRELWSIHRVFVYLPYEHSEDMERQHKSIELFHTLAEEAESGEQELFSGYLDFADQHFQIIERFGRYPHRNDILGRESTDAEKEFLAQPGSSF